MTKFESPPKENDLESSVQQSLDSVSCCSLSTKIFSTYDDSETIPRNYFTAAYDPHLHHIFAEHFNKDDIEATFLPKDRIALTDEILTRTSFSELDKDPFESFGNFEADSQKGIQRLLADKTFEDAYPLHDAYDAASRHKETKNDRELLMQQWASFRCCFRKQPLHIIRRYFGEKIGFYFCWLGFYTKALVLPSIVGVLVLLYGIASVFGDVPTRDICETGRLGNRLMCPQCVDKWCSNSTYELKEHCNYARVSML